MAKPFRFNEMPPELRDRDYGWHFVHLIMRTLVEGSSTIDNFASHWDPTYEPCPTMPELTFVSRSIDAEVIPFLYKNSVVCFRCNWNGSEEDESEENWAPEDGSEEDGFNGSNQERRWAERGIRGNVRLLRMLGVDDIYRNVSAGVLMELKDRVGLVAHFDKSFPPDKQQAWEQHIANLEKGRKELGLQGEALILCFTSKLELWQ
ncbi:hypothetical protein LTR49_024555 [Elasticomyces elasticus]|nr:hypothetical protein LTR49_024555 [Elasticomyces elasticus]